MNRKATEKQVYRTTTVGQLVAALIESRDQTDICYVFEHHQVGTFGFEIACQHLGISEADWDYANNVGGFYSLVEIIGEKLGLPRYDPAAEKGRVEQVTGLMKSPEARNQRNEPVEPTPPGFDQISQAELNHHPGRIFAERNGIGRSLLDPEIETRITDDETHRRYAAEA
jgi:hypothetical protein